MIIVPTDEAKESFVIPAWLNKMVENNWLGDKTGQGFFKKIKGRQVVKKKFMTLESCKRLNMSHGKNQNLHLLKLQNQLMISIPAVENAGCRTG